MTSELVTNKPQIVLTPRLPRDQHPVHVYIGRLRAPSSRRVMLSALHKMAVVLTSGKVTDAQFLQWHRVECDHTADLRAALIEEYRPATVDKMLAALRGVLKECWRLGYMDAEQYLRTSAIKTVKAELPVHSRVLSATGKRPSKNLGERL